MRLLDNGVLVELLRSRVKSAGGQSAFARQHGIQRAYLNRVLNGKKPPAAPSILNALNLRAVCVPVEPRGRVAARLLNDDDVLKLLHSQVRRAGGQSSFARQIRVDRTFLNKVLSGKKPPSAPSILEALNLRIAYAPVP